MFSQVRQINSDLTATQVDSGYLPIRRISPVTVQTGGFSALTDARLAETCALGAVSPRPGTGALASLIASSGRFYTISSLASLVQTGRFATCARLVLSDRRWRDAGTFGGA